MTQHRMVDSDYIKDALGVSRASAYRVIRDLNRELEASGVRTLPGRVSLTFFEKRFFSIPGEEVGSDGGQPQP